MNLIKLFDYFDRITESPEAVPKLRQFIFDLAVRAKLVPQDPTDEPASDLFRRIQKHKAAVIQSKGGHQEEPLSAVDQAPFQIPKSWMWTRWEAIALKIGDMDHKMPEAVKQGVPFISPRDFRPGNRIDFDNAKRVSVEDFARLSKKIKAEPGDLIYPRYGTIGENRLVTEKRDFLVSYSCAIVKVMPELIDPQFQYLYSISTFCRDQAREAENKSTQANVGIKSIQDFIVPLPPLAEQKRIVAKVERLMALCDQLEQSVHQQQNRRMQVSRSALHGLTNGASPDELHRHSRFYLQHLKDFTAVPSQIPELRRAILSLAVRGRLAPQEQGEEPASEIIRRIQAEKSRRIVAIALRKEKPLPSISRDEEPFAIPANWTWTRVGTCALLTEYGTSVKSEDLQDGVPVLAMGDIQLGQVILSVRKKVPRQIEDLPQLFLKHGDLLYNRTNSAELVGKTGIFLGADDAFTFASYLIRLRFLPEFVNPAYVNLAMNAPYFRETQIVPELRQQCGQANVNGTKLRNMLIPLPPTDEQHRIVKRVEQLMALSGQIEVRLAAALGQKNALLESVLHHSLNSMAPQGFAFPGAETA